MLQLPVLAHESWVVQRGQQTSTMCNKNNEGKVCDAVVRFIEKQTDEIRMHIRHPEIDGVGPPVDLRLMLGAQEYAIEHTRIEPYDNQIKTEVIIKEILDYFKENISLPFPSPAYYQLQYPFDVSLPNGKAKRNRALNNLVEWVCTKEKVLRERNRGRPMLPYGPYFADHSVHGKPDGFNCTFDLLRWPDATFIRQKPGSLWLRPIIPKDMEPLRRKRLMRAFHKKCEKLQRCKEEGARSVLVLESSDVALTSFEFRGNLLPEILAKHSNAPDEIFLVETYPDLWWVWPLKCDNDHWPAVGMPELNQPIYETDKLPTVGVPKREREALGLDKPYKPHPKGWIPETFEKDELNDLTPKRRRTET